MEWGIVNQSKERKLTAQERASMKKKAAKLKLPQRVSAVFDRDLSGQEIAEELKTILK